MLRQLIRDCVIDWLILSILSGSASAQAVRLMSTEKETALRASLPEIDDPNITERIADALLYTDEEIPPAFQFQPLHGGTGAPYTVFAHRHTSFNDLDRAGQFTNGNREFPWRTPGGIDRAEKYCDEFRFISLPRKKDGSYWPIVVYRDRLDRSTSVNMPAPTGYKWIYPNGTVIGEVLVMNFNDGYKYTYEVRIREREPNDWNVDVFRPFTTAEQLGHFLSQHGNESASAELLAAKSLRRQRLADRHPTRAFDVTSGIDPLPEISGDLIKLALTTGPFSSAAGTTWRTGSNGVTADAPTNEREEANLVPPGYNATFLGNDRTGCVNCHKHTLRHVSAFQNRDWYGYIRGSDGIFSFHPIEPSSIGTGEERPVRMRRELVEAGMVEAYDPDQHPSSMYARAKAYDNRLLPQSAYRLSGYTIQGF